MPFTRKWKEKQVDLLSFIEAEIYPSGCETSLEFARYARSYSESLPASWVAAKREEILSQARGLTVLLVGDYHTHPASAATMLWLIDELSRSGRRLALFLEALPDGFNDSIARYMEGELPEDRFLEIVGYGGSFGFDFGIYRPLLVEAQRRGMTVRGINTRATAAGLSLRDGFAAGVIAREMAADQEATALVLIGERHLAPPHLPRLLRRSLVARAVPARIVTVHRNVESVFFDTIEPERSGLPPLVEQPSICLRSAASRDTFLIQDISPLTLRTGDLNWFRARELWNRFPDTGPSERSVNVVFDFDEVSLFEKALDSMASLLALKRGDADGDDSLEDAVDDFHIFTGDDLYFLERFGNDGMEPERLDRIREMLDDPGFFYLPDYRLVYMRHLTPFAMGSAAVLHLAAAKNGGRGCENAFLNAVRAAIGASLFDPCSIEKPQRPFHPMHLHPAGSERSLEQSLGRDVGLDIFRALVAGTVPPESLGALLGDEDASLEALSEILASL